MSTNMTGFQLVFKTPRHCALNESSLSIGRADIPVAGGVLGVRPFPFAGRAWTLPELGQVGRSSATDPW